MRLDALEVTNFRNIKAAMIRPDPGVNIFAGDNAAGKTNLLEAIFTLCLGRSQRGARDVMMVGEGGGDFYRLEGIGQTSGGQVRLTCAFQKGGRKRITIDGNPGRISQLFKVFSLISMAPEDAAIFSGPPSARRRFIDLHMSQASPGYLADLTNYNKALAQKNSFLKSRSDEACPFDPLMVQHGSGIIAARQNFIHFLQALAPGYYHQISDGKISDDKLAFVFDYRPNIPFAGKDEIAVNFEKKLKQYRQKEAVLETSIIGPHRDDIDFRIAGFPARGYGSQGELRSAAVALLMAAANFLESRRDEKPILLLDEVFAEFDDARRENLTGLFDRFDQIFLTAAANPPKKLLDRGRLYYVREGKVSEN
jgi:DNA replication and repair protein RecF